MEAREKLMIKELCEVEEGLTDREVEFIEDMSKRDSRYEVSERQLKWLEDLWKKHCLK